MTREATMGQRGVGGTLPIHGDSDPVVLAEAGSATVDAVAGAELLVIEGTRHDLANEVWPPVVAAIVRHARGHDLR